MTTQPETINALPPHLIAALEFYNAGVCVIPAMKGKRPAMKWEQYQQERPTPQQLIEWFRDGQTGIGIVTGTVSGNLEMVEAEGRAIAAGLVTKAEEIATATGLQELWNKLLDGYTEITPSGGYHWLYRIENPPTPFPGNYKIASQPGPEETGSLPLFETRGEGGFVVTAPTSGDIHPSGEPWTLIGGSRTTIPTITWEERNAIHAIFASLDQMPHVEPVEIRQQYKSVNGHVSPGDDFNNKATWEEVLLPHGWQKAFQVGKETRWTRPGKTIRDGISASSNHTDKNNLYVFSTSTVFEAGSSYSKFAAYTYLNFGGNFSAAASDLYAKGYGDRKHGDLVDASFLMNPAPENVNYETGEIQEYVLTEDDRLYQYELLNARIKRRVRQELDSEEAAKSYESPTYVETLAEEILLPDEDPTWAVDQLIPTGGNVLLTAAYKSGKTTMVNNLVKSLVDGNSFLGTFDISAHAGRVVVFNYEVDERTYRRWIRNASIENMHQVTLVHLRGRRMPMTVQHVQDEIVEILTKLQCQTWIVDPFARAFSGSGDENSNSDVGVFLETLDVIKERAGVENMILTTHTGRAQENGIERARGATRIDDWADVRWILTKSSDGTRFISASGRDVELEESKLDWDEESRQMTIGNMDMKTYNLQSIEDKICTFVMTNPDCKTGDIKAAISGKDDLILKALSTAVATGKLTYTEMGRAKFYRSTAISSWNPEVINGT